MKIENSKELHDIYTPDKLTDVFYFLDGTAFYPSACTKLLIIKRDEKLIATTAWFITNKNNELIYDIENNDWVNLNMFDDGDSYCKEICYVSLKEDQYD